LRFFWNLTWFLNNMHLRFANTSVWYRLGLICYFTSTNLHPFLFIFHFTHRFWFVISAMEFIEKRRLMDIPIDTKEFYSLLSSGLSHKLSLIGCSIHSYISSAEMCADDCSPSTPLFSPPFYLPRLLFDPSPGTSESISLKGVSFWVFECGRPC